MYPVTDDVEALQERTTECTIGATPFPASETELGEVGVLLERLRVAVTLPPAVGVNSSVKLLLCPGVNVAGRLKPLMV